MKNNKMQENKNIYPFWWWNFPDSDDEMESYINYDNNNKSQKSFNNYSSSKNSEYDEAKIFQRSGFNNNYYNYSFKERMEIIMDILIIPIIKCLLIEI